MAPVVVYSPVRYDCFPFDLWFVAGSACYLFFYMSHLEKDNFNLEVGFGLVADMWISRLLRKTLAGALASGVAFLSHLFLAGFLSIIIVRNMYRSYLVLPPSSATRHREPLRKNHVRLYSLLALLSLAVAGTYSYQFCSLSYRVWALERGVELPGSIFGDSGAFRGGEHPGRLQLFRWLDDTTYFRDSVEIVAEKTRYFWWGEQALLGLISWGVYLAIQGQRRNIPHLWAFVMLAHLVSLSYAQNLFFLTVLLTPVPLPENAKDLTRSSMPITSSRFSRIMKNLGPPNPNNFLPSPYLYMVILALEYAIVFLFPFASNTPSFMPLNITANHFPYFFLALPYITPKRWGTVLTHPHSAHSTYRTLFRTISTISFLFHFKSTITALFYNTPDSSYHRHSLLHPFQREHRSALNRGTTAVGRIFGAIGEHPAVSAVGWNVILSGLSLGVWAAIRGLDAMAMLEASVLLVKPTERVLDELVNTTENITAKAEEAIEATPSTRRRTNGATKGTSEDANAAEAIPGPQATKRRGRPRKNPIVEDADDAAYQPLSGELVEEGDEAAEDDWEAAGLGWGLITMGGLGFGSASVYGAEVVAR